jgi:hypothetical protein
MVVDIRDDTRYDVRASNEVCNRTCLQLNALRVILMRLLCTASRFHRVDSCWSQTASVKMAAVRRRISASGLSLAPASRQVHGRLAFARRSHVCLAPVRLEKTSTFSQESWQTVPVALQHSCRPFYDDWDVYFQAVVISEWSWHVDRQDSSPTQLSQTHSRTEETKYWASLTVKFLVELKPDTGIRDKLYFECALI